MIAIHPADFADLQSMHREWMTTRRPQAGVMAKKRRGAHAVLRVMIIDKSYPVYSPKTNRECAYFIYAPDMDTTTIEMSGDDLFGNLIVTIDGTEYTVDCQSNTEEIRAVFGFALDYCRVTSFPGMWEFAWSGTAPEMTVEPKLTASTNTIYTGGVLIIEEGWVSDTDGGGDYLTIPVVDAMPFLEGELKRGSRAIASRSDGVGWLVHQWQCRDFRFRPS